MKIKNLLIALGLASIAGVGWYVLNEDGNKEAAYVPRSDYNKLATGAEGAFEYYEMIKGNVYTGKVEKEDILTMQTALKKNKVPKAKNSDISWESMGPDNVGGRTRAILELNDDPNTLLAGGVSGGIFRTNDAAQSWSVVPGFDPYLIVSSMAQLDVEGRPIYVATGNSRERAQGVGGSGFIGRGLFVSNDNGQTFELVNDFEPSPYSTGSIWSNIDVIKADPVVPNKLWIGSNFGLYPFIHGSSELEETTLFIETQSGSTIPVTSNVKDLDISADGQNFLVAAGDAIFVSRDAGETFTHVNCSSCFSGIDVTDLGATEVVISQNDADIMYVTISQGNGFLRGIYATVDGGLNWNLIAPQSNAGGQISQFAPFFNGLTSQGWYDNMLTSVPNSESEQIIMGGIRLWKYELVGATPGITAWESINANFSSFPGGQPSPIYVHSDIHTDEWDSQGRLYTGTDGGVFRTSNEGATWSALNKGYVTTQFYSIAFNSFGQVLGGLQDNGSLWLSLEGVNPKFAKRFSGGDGFDCEISQYLPNYMFSTIYNGEIFRSTDGGINVFPLLTSTNGGGGNDFTTDIALHENPNDEDSEIFIEYSPTLDSPYLEFYDEPIIQEDGDTVIARIPAGSEIQVEAINNDYVLDYTTNEDILFYSFYLRELGDEVFEFHNVADTALVQETPQFMLAAVLSDTVVVTRQPYKTNGVPQFYKVDDIIPASPTSVEWSPDGDHLYIGYRNGQLVRLSNFQNAWTEEEMSKGTAQYALTRTVIFSAGGFNSPVTDIEVDYSMGQGDDASERVVVSIGGYGGDRKVEISNEAASASGVGTFTDIWNVSDDFQGMPVYSVVMDVVDPDIILAGTEYGVWYTGDGGQTWSEANNGDMPRVPVFDLRQQKRLPWQVENGGVVYAGTHGRGVMRTNYLLTTTSTDDIAEEVPDLNGLKVFPNPVTSKANVSFDLGTTADIELYVYSVDGRLIESFQEQRVGAGANRQIEIDASDYSLGSYIVQLRVGETWNSAKFVVTR